MSPTPVADDADATVRELHERATEDYASNRPYREYQEKQGGGQQ